MTDAPAPAPAPPTFEAALKQLEDIVQKLERGDLPLEESLGLYEQGIRLSRLCQTRLGEAETRVDTLLKDSRGEPQIDRDGQPRIKPFNPESAG